VATRGRKAKRYPRWFQTRLNWLRIIGVSYKTIMRHELYRPMSNLAFKVRVNEVMRAWR